LLLSSRISSAAVDVHTIPKVSSSSPPMDLPVAGSSPSPCLPPEPPDAELYVRLPVDPPDPPVPPPDPPPTLWANAFHRQISSLCSASLHHSEQKGLLLLENTSATWNFNSKSKKLRALLLNLEASVLSPDNPHINSSLMESDDQRFRPSSDKAYWIPHGDQVSKDVSQVSCFKPSYINSLQENLAAMQRDMEELKARQTDVLRRVESEEETRSMQRTAQVMKLNDLKSESITKTATKGNVTLDASAIEELQHLKRLESLKIDIDISSGSALKKLFSALGIEELCIRDLQRDEAHLVLPTTMEQLRKIVIKSCGIVEIEIGRESYDTFLILERDYNWLRWTQGSDVAPVCSKTCSP
ncbi:hypothetical protein HID58_058729, partial [Brassica napus]